MKVRMTGWCEGFSVVETCNFLVATGKLNLLQAKRACESVLEGKEVVLEVDSEEQRSQVVDSLKSLHVTTAIDW